MMEMTAEREGTILEEALLKWGESDEIDVAIEEMSELTKALIKFRRSRFGPQAVQQALADSVREEIADVQIMINQMQLIFGDVSDWKFKKLERLAERLGME